MGEQIIGVLTLKPAVYREIADDTNATLTAGIIVAIVALFVGLAGGIVTAVTRHAISYAPTSACVRNNPMMATSIQL